MLGLGDSGGMLALDKDYLACADRIQGVFSFESWVSAWG